MTFAAGDFGHLSLRFFCCGYCPKILYTDLSDRMAHANGADRDQTAGAGFTLFAISPSFLWNKYIKMKSRSKSIK